MLLRCHEYSLYLPHEHLSQRIENIGSDTYLCALLERLYTSNNWAAIDKDRDFKIVKLQPLGDLPSTPADAVRV